MQPYRIASTMRILHVPRVTWLWNILQWLRMHFDSLLFRQYKLLGTWSNDDDIDMRVESKYEEIPHDVCFQTVLCIRASTGETLHRFGIEAARSATKRTCPTFSTRFELWSC